MNQNQKQNTNAKACSPRAFGTKDKRGEAKNLESKPPKNGVDQRNSKNKFELQDGVLSMAIRLTTWSSTV